jgi:hypothetical protein
MSLWDDAGAIPPVLTAEKLAGYLKGNPDLINEQEPKTGLTPLAKALNAGNASTVDLLLKNGASADKKTADGRTPMYLAADASRQRARMIQLLLAKNPTTFDDEGPDFVQKKTPLMAAVLKGDADAVKLLVDIGASKDKKNSAGKTPKELVDESKPTAAKVKQALDTVPSKGAGGLMTYIKSWVLPVLAYFNLWRPLADVFDAASRSYYGIAAPGPFQGEVSPPISTETKNRSY